MSKYKSVEVREVEKVVKVKVVDTVTYEADITFHSTHMVTGGITKEAVKVSHGQRTVLRNFLDMHGWAGVATVRVVLETEQVPDVTHRVLAEWDATKSKINMIKLYRELTQLPLYDSKQDCESLLFEHRGVPLPDSYRGITLQGRS